MAYQPLTKEQFQAARTSGFTPEQITSMEQRRLRESTIKSSEKGDGIFKSILKAPIKSLFVKPIVRTAQAATALGAKALGKDALAENIATQDVNVDVPILGKYKIEAPSTKKAAAGEALEVASYLFPFGKAAKGAGAVAKALKVPAAAKVGQVAAGAAGGYLADFGFRLQDGLDTEEAAIPGLATAIGAAIPMVGPVKRAITRTLGESVGATTGTGYGVIKSAYEATSAGGEKSRAFLDSMRGKISPEKIVSDAKTALGVIASNRREAYQQQLKVIAGDTTKYDIKPIINEVSDQLKKFNVGISKDGVLDFSRSTIRFDKPSQKEVETIVREMEKFGLRKGDRTAIGIDNLKRALGDLYSESSNVRAFTAAVGKKARSILSQVKGYDDLAKNYGEQTGLIKEISKSLSLGDKASVDTAFRKLSSALRTNNEFRRQLVQELDDASGGFLSSEIAGQQLSEFLPRGLIRPVGAVGGVGALAGGTALLPLLKLAAVTSPRIVGEVLAGLGMSRRMVNGLCQALESATGKLRFPGDALLDSPLGQKATDLVKKGKGAIPKLGSEAGIASPKALASAGIASAAGVGIKGLSETGNTETYPGGGDMQEQGPQLVKQKATSTNYDPYDPKQNDPNRKKEDIGKGAAGVFMTDKMVAVGRKKPNSKEPLLPYGTVIRIDGEEYLVADIKNMRYHTDGYVDFATPHSGKRVFPELNGEKEIEIVELGTGPADARRKARYF